jgi:hypothetical protein
MVLLGDISQVEACFRPFGDIINLDGRQVHGLHRMYNGHGNLFRHWWGHPFHWHNHTCCSPMTRARAQQLNYQLKSFLAVHTNLSQNWMLLNHGDDCLIPRNVGQDSIASCLDPMMRMEQPNKWESSLMGRTAHLETVGDTPSKVP